jgi:hypothetical protein
MKSVVLCFPETPRVAALALLASALLFACAEQGASAPNSSGQPADAQPDAPPADTDASLDNDDVISTVPGPNDCTGAGTDAATARCLQPTQTPEYYIEQALKYFDTLDTDADPLSIPNYAAWVARWEWPPWLLLTGIGAVDMKEISDSLRLVDPSTVPFRDCRFFDEQPFARCYVSFEYEEGPCPIYEEFIFNDAGEMTFIEAWSDIDGLRPTSEADRWGEAADFPRLGTRIPGLGRPDGQYVLTSEPMRLAAQRDAEIADFVRRGLDFWPTWLAEFQNAGDDFFAVGCGWE